jgi:predicted nucleic acid-binding protein
VSIVLDASVTLTWCFADEATAHSNAVMRSLRESRAIVPALWIYEIENALVNGFRRKRITKKAIAEFRDALAKLPIDVQPPPSPWGRTAEVLHDIAVEHQITAYDASYLTIAVELGIPLATLDGTGKRQGLKQAAERVGVELFVPK